jgi:hypothetical protein
MALDYAKWVQRLSKFIAALQNRSPAGVRECFFVDMAPPLDKDEVEELADSLDVGLPPPLRRFLTTGASSVSFQYAWPKAEDETSDVFCPADELADWREECLEYARDSWLQEGDWPLEYAFWRHALPLVHYPDGDGVALWVHDPEHPDPPVVYLKHEGASFVLSRTFDEFLEQWERVGYTGTNGLEAFRNRESGFLDWTTPTAAALRKSLGLAS